MMLRPLLLLALLLVGGPAGCSRAADYLAIFEEQRAALNEIGEVLAKIRDEAGMAEAKGRLDDRLDKFEGIVRRANALPQPSLEVRERLEQERYLMQRAVDRVQAEVRRVRGLPGGDAFFQQFNTQKRNLLMP